MAALGQARMGLETRWKNIPLPLAAGEIAYQGGIACIDTTAYDCTPGAGGNANLVKVGEFLETLDNADATVTNFVMVSLDFEIVTRWYDNATGGAAVVNLFTSCYILDDHTVTATAGSNSVCGRVWALDPVKGVCVEALSL